MRWLISLYPKNWRVRYGDELEYLLEQRKISFFIYIDIFRGALDAWNIEFEEGKLITRKNFLHFNNIRKRDATMQKRLYILFGLSVIAFLIFANSSKVNDIQTKILSIDELKELAHQEDSEAQMELAFYYEAGYKIELNYSESLRWYIKSAENGNTYAMVNLAHLYRKGKGVEQDFGKAFSWNLKAAELGNFGGMFNVGKQYELGVGVSQNEDKANYWLAKSGKN